MSSRWFSRNSRSTRKRPPQHAQFVSTTPWNPELPRSNDESREGDLITPAFTWTEDHLHSAISSDVLAEIANAPEPRVPTSPEPEEDRKMKAKPSPNREQDTVLESAASAKLATHQCSGDQSINGPAMIPIAPGVTARLRGADETWSCIERDCYSPTVCLACSLELCCIQDADFVICPVCKVVSPLEEGGFASDVAAVSTLEGSSSTSSSATEQSVGLGFTLDDLGRWQFEIIARRAHLGHPSPCPTV